MTGKTKRKLGRPKPGDQPSEMAFHKLALLDDVIAAIERARQEQHERIAAGGDLGSCSINLFGYEAGYLLRSLKAARNLDKDPFSIKAAFHAKATLSLPEQAAIAREVLAALDDGSASSVLDAAELVSNRHPLGGAAIENIYYKMKDFI